MNVIANEDRDQVTVLVERGDVSVLATIDRDASQTALLEALSVADAHLQHGLHVPMHHPRERTELAADGGRA